MALIRERLGIFSGFGESAHEIVSQVLVPYSQKKMPLQGAFLVVEQDDLQGRRSGLLGRVTRATPIGDLFSTAGEDYLVDLVRMKHQVPEEVKSGRLRYRISLRLLGQISQREDGTVEYSPAIRQMPHVGADVGFPNEEVTRFIARGCPNPAEDPGPVIGNLAVGDLAFDGSDRAMGRTIEVHFRMESLIGRRTAVFARAGMGKSNFTKVLLTRLYGSGRKDIPGTLVIDPEGEYAFANASEPGLLDVPSLRDRVVVYTEREFDDQYRHAVAGDCMVNFCDLDPIEAVNNLLPEEKQNLVFANHLRSLDQARWSDLIKSLEVGGYQTTASTLSKIMRTKYPEGDVIPGAIKNNLLPAMARLHDKKSRMVQQVKESLRDGKIVILDVSMLAAQDARLIAAWILRTLFANNQAAYTTVRHQEGSKAAARSLIPCMAVFEEAQFYLGGTTLREDSAFVRWFKEGRKFGLGSILVTQQPGAIGPELISQCDNFFVFHLLSRIDLEALATANLHYGGDIAMSIGHEPIAGNCYLWSGRGLSFVTCARILHFARVVAEDDKRKRPVERVATTVRKPAREVQLPVQTVNLSPSHADEYIVAMVRRLIETEKSVFLFNATMQDGAGGSESSCLSVVDTYLLNAVKKAVDADVKSGKAPADVPDRLPLTAQALAEILHRAGHSPAPRLFTDEKDKQHLAFHASFIDATKRKPGASARLQ